MPSLGKRLSQAHLKPQVRAQSKQGQTLVFPMPLPSLGCSAEAAVAASYVWLISATPAYAGEEGRREAMGRSQKHGLGWVPLIHVS